MNFSKEKIAIIGMSGRFPDSPSLQEFWHNLCQGKELISFFSDEELNHISLEVIKDPSFVKAKGMIKGIDLFDAELFAYSRREAETMDPQQRILLECAWEALEDAGYNGDSYDGLIGVFLGASLSTYFLFNLLPHLQKSKPISQEETLVLMGNDKDFLASRISYKLNLKGPSQTIQTACSTSLVAVHYACQSLLSGDTDLALAGGASITCPERNGYFYQEEGINSPDGHCRAFDANCKGTLIGNGAGIIVLKRLSEAIKDKDNILAIIRGSAVNNDGGEKIGFTAPSLYGQTEVISTAHAIAQVHPEEISYIEAHGTGTSLGDPIEIKALTNAFNLLSTKKNFCALGSVKTNIGHLDAAAGIAGLIKTILSLQYKEIPPSLHYEKPNPNIDFASSPFYVNTRLIPWIPNKKDVRIAGVSSFGIGGTNAHVIVQEAPLRSLGSTPYTSYLFPFSAHTPNALNALLQRFHTFLLSTEESLSNITYTLQTGRKTLRYRSYFICKNKEEALQKLLSCSPTQLTSSYYKLLWFFNNPQKPKQDILDTEKYTFYFLKDKAQDILAHFDALNSRLSLYSNLQQMFTSHYFSLFYLYLLLITSLLEVSIKPEKILAQGIGKIAINVALKYLSLEEALKLIQGIEKRQNPSFLLSSIPQLFEENDLKIGKDDLLYPLKNKEHETDKEYTTIQIGLNGEENDDNLALNYIEKSFLQFVGQSWLYGYPIKWNLLYKSEKPSRVSLPTYPFERKSYWIDPPAIKLQHHSNPNEIPQTHMPQGIQGLISYFWRSVLRIDQVKETQNFFELGGDSLIALEILELIRQHLYISISLKSLFENPTLKEFTLLVNEQLINKVDELEEEKANKILQLIAGDV